MNQKKFIEQLRGSLSFLPEEEINEIIRDQEEYIQDAIRSGRNEPEVIASLGDPKLFAASLNATTKIKRAASSIGIKQQVRHTFQAVFAVLALAPFNLIFVLGPFLGVLGLLFGGWIGTVSLLVSSLFIMLAFFLKFILAPYGILSFCSALFFLFGLFGLSSLLLSLMFHLSQFFFKLTLQYLKWNLSFLNRISDKGEN